MALGIRPRRALTGTLAVAVLAALVVATPSAPASPAVLTSSISVSGTAGNFFFFAPGKANISWSQGLYYQGEYIDVSASTLTGGSQYHFRFGTPTGSGQHLVPRFYQWAQDFSEVRGPGRPGIDVTGNQPGCGPQTGWFEVRDIHRVGGEITRLWLVFARWCNPSWVEHGELRLGYPQAAYDVSPQVVTWPWTTVYPGQAAEEVPVKVRLTSPGPVTVGTPSVSGADAGDFPIRRRNCTDVALTATGCTVWVGFTPTAPGPRHATLSVPTSAGPVDVPLDATGGVGTSDWTVNIDTDPPFPDEHLVMASPSKGNPREIISEAYEPQPDGTYQLWYLRFGLAGGPLLEPGATYTYHPATAGYPFYLDLARGTGDCEISWGQVTLNDLAWAGPDQDLDRMDARLVANCKANPPWKVKARVRFHARADITPPGTVTGLNAVRNGDQVTVTWANPPDPDLAGVIVRWSPARTAPSVWWAANTASFGTGTSATFTARATKPVSISAWTYDTTGNVSPITSIHLP